MKPPPVYIRVQIHPEDEPLIDKIVQARVHEDLATLGGHLLATHDQHPALASLGGFLLEHYGQPSAG